jgi:hypothetical protein
MIGDNIEKSELIRVKESVSRVKVLNGKEKNLQIALEFV